MKPYLFLLLALCACNRAELATTEVIAVRAYKPTPGYQSVQLGDRRSPSLPWELVSDEGPTKVYQLPADSLAFGVVPTTQILYTFHEERADVITIEAPGSERHNLRACLQELYGKPMKNLPYDAEWKLDCTTIGLSGSPTGPATVLYMNLRK